MDLVRGGYDVRDGRIVIDQASLPQLEDHQGHDQECVIAAIRQMVFNNSTNAVRLSGMTV